MQTLSQSSLSRRTPLLFALLFALVIGGSSRPARADLVTGLDAAFTVDTIIGVGSLVSIGGNAADLALRKPHRGWIYSGFILGTANLAAGLITIFFGGDPVQTQGTNMCLDKPSMTMNPCGPNTPEIQYGLGVAQTILGATNLALAIRNAVIWHRLRVAESQQAPPPPPTALSSLRVAPMVHRDLAGAPLYGVTLSLAGF
jgi:hypothetical protein